MPLITIIINAKKQNTINLHILGHRLIVTEKDWTTQLVTRIFTMYLGQEVLKKKENDIYTYKLYV